MSDINTANMKLKQKQEVTEIKQEVKDIKQKQKAEDEESHSINFKIVGTLDFLAKMWVRDLNEETMHKYMPRYLWHDTYLVKTTYRKMMNAMGHQKNTFVIVDNLTEQGDWFLLKDTNARHTISATGYDTHQTYIFEGSCPAMITMAKENYPEKGIFLHIKEAEKREQVLDRIEQLLEFSDEVYICVGIYPELLVCDYAYLPMTEELKKDLGV